MKPRAFDPLKLDVAAFVASGMALTGHWPMAELSRLAASQWSATATADCHDGSAPARSGMAPTGADVTWSARGEQRRVTGGAPELWLHLQAQAEVWLSCQRCLQPFAQPIEVERRLRFVRDEAQAEALDAELDDDVLALTRSLDLRELVEDELLLALPLVPRHERCPAPLPMSAGELDDAGDDGDPDRADDARPNPFAALQALKRRVPN